MKTIFYFIKKSILKFILGALLSFAGGLCGTFAIKQLNDAVHNGLEDLSSFVIPFGIGIGCFIILSLFATRFLAVIIQSSIYELRKQFALKLTQADFQKIENRKKEILNVFTHDITLISNTIDKLPDQFIGLSFSLGIFGYLLYLSPSLSSLIIMVFTSSFFLIMITNKRLRYYAEQYRIAWEKCFSKLNDLIFGLRELNLNSQHKNYFIEKELPEVLKNELHFKVKERINIQVSNKIAESLMMIGLAVIVVIIYRTGFVSFEFFAEFLLLSLFMVSPLAGFASFMKNLRPVEASLKHIDALGISLTQDRIQTEKLELNKEYGKEIISLESISYTHKVIGQEFNFTLGPIDLKIYENEILFITGGNGSGKTTLSKLITGLYIPEGGKIRLKGAEILERNIMNLRDEFASIYSDNYIFEDINYIDFDSSHANRLLKEYHLHRRVREEEGLYTDINLSTGQLKRLAMVTAILEDKNIYLFDEWAANQDLTFKKIFYKELLPQLKNAGKTIIVISHDEHFYSSADRVIKIVNGKELLELTPENVAYQ